MPKSIQRSVKDLDWVGWNYIEDLVDQSEGIARGLILVGFKTGSRVSEFLPLHRDQFSFQGDFWTVTAPLLKGYKSVVEKEKWKCKKCDRRWPEKPTTIKGCSEGGTHELESYRGYETRRIEKQRTPEFPSDEPLSAELKEYVEDCEDLLFPHPYDDSEPAKRAYAYKKIVGVDDDIWPHWLRAQRACQLAEESDFTLDELQDWFGWETSKYARFYRSRKYTMREKMSEPKRRIR